jgi:cystathionine beta-synthase
VARREGILMGGSSGTNIAAALRYARRLSGDHLVVALGADTGRNYLSKCYNDEWLAENKLIEVEHKTYSIGDLLRNRGPRELATVSPRDTIAATIELMQSRGISQVPVLDKGTPVGSVQEVTIARVLHDEKDPNTLPVGDVMARPLPVLDATTHLDEAYRLLMSGHTGVLVTQNGKVVDIITRIDLVQYWNRAKEGK